MAVRVSLGASRSRLIAMLMVESLILAIGGGVLGMTLARAAASRLATLPIPIGFPIAFDFSVDLSVLAFTAVVSTLATLAFGMAPALEASRVNLVASLSGTAARPGRRRARSALVVVQLAASVALLAGAGLFIRAMHQAAALNLGLETTDIAVMSKDVPDRYADPRLYADELMTSLAALPDVHAVHLGRSAELSFLNWKADITVPGYESADAESMTFYFNSVTPGYHEVLRMPVLAGRTFTSTDTVGAPRVALVNEAFAERFWPARSALGETFTVLARRGIEGDDDVPPQDVIVVGVVQSGRYPDVDDEPEPFFWTPLLQDPSRKLVIHLQARPGAPTGADGMVTILQRDVELEPNELTILTATPLDGLVDIQLLKLWIPSRALSYGGSFGLLLSVIGIYGLVSFAVTTRRREIAIRMAIGARRGRVTGSIVGGVLRLAAFGLVLGLLLVVPVAELMRSRLFGVGPLDPVALGSASAVLLMAVVAASYLAARRAAEISPAEILREE